MLPCHTLSRLLTSRPAFKYRPSFLHFLPASSGRILAPSRLPSALLTMALRSLSRACHTIWYVETPSTILNASPSVWYTVGSGNRYGVQRCRGAARAPLAFGNAANQGITEDLITDLAIMIGAAGYASAHHPKLRNFFCPALFLDCHHGPRAMHDIEHSLSHNYSSPKPAFDAQPDVSYLHTRIDCSNPLCNAYPTVT